jgi:hypothetical protein
MHSHIRTLLVLVVAAGAAACARAYPPPGGEQDRLPPGLVTTTPAPLAVLPGFSGPVVFRFDERISERNFSEALVMVSPLDGAMRVQRRGNEVRVEIDGGWRADRVYRVVLLPGIRDLHGNVRDEPAEVVFSTGPPVPSTAIAGLVFDRLTARPAQNAVVRAVRRGDDVAYTAVGDTAGFFALRHLPMGVYDVEAFTDLNRNRRRDAAEPVAGEQVSLSAAADTSTIIFHVLAPDSTPPRPTRAEIVDSMRVRITFDDHFDPEQAQPAASAELHALPDSTAYGTARRILVGTVYDLERRTPPPQPRDTAAADTAVAQQVPQRTPAPARGGQAPQQPLPARELVIELDRPLRPGTYSVTVRNFVNIHGLTGGGVVRLQVQGPQRTGG